MDSTHGNKHMDVVNEDFLQNLQAKNCLNNLTDSSKILLENDCASFVTEKSDKIKIVRDKSMIKNPYTKDRKKLKEHFKQVKNTLENLQSESSKHNNKVFDIKQTSIDDKLRNIKKKEIANVYKSYSKSPIVHNHSKSKHDLEGHLNLPSLDLKQNSYMTKLMFNIVI